MQTMNRVFIAAAIASLSATSGAAAQSPQQFDLACQVSITFSLFGGPGWAGQTRVVRTYEQSLTFAIDLAAQRLCVRSGDEPCFLASLRQPPTQDQLDLSFSDDGSTWIVNRNTGQIAYLRKTALPFDEPGEDRREGTGQCVRQTFSGIPAPLF